MANEDPPIAPPAPVAPAVKPVVITAQQRIEQLEKELAAERAARQSSEDNHARTLSEAQNAAIQTSDVREVPAGETDTGVALWWYKIDLPPSGGEAVRLSGLHYYHGETYKVSAAVLSTLKDIVWRAWAHNAEIMGSNENAYRRPQEKVLRGNARR